MLTMSPGALQQGQPQSVGPPKVVGEILKGSAASATVGGTAVRRRNAPEQPAVGGAPATAAMVLAKDMATGRGKSSGAVPNPRSPRVAARSSGIPIRPKPVPPSVSKKSTAAVDDNDDRKRQPKCRRPTSAESRRVKVHNIHINCVWRTGATRIYNNMRTNDYIFVFLLTIYRTRDTSVRNVIINYYTCIYKIRCLGVCAEIHFRRDGDCVFQVLHNIIS